jgi:hypothetical protein
MKPNKLNIMQLTLIPETTRDHRQHNIALVLLQNQASWAASKAQAVRVRTIRALVRKGTHQPVIEDKQLHDGDLKAHGDACGGHGLGLHIERRRVGGGVIDRCIILSGADGANNMTICQQFLQRYYAPPEPGAGTDDDIRVWGDGTIIGADTENPTPRGQRKSVEALQQELFSELLLVSKTLIRSDNGGKSERVWAADCLITHNIQLESNQILREKLITLIVEVRKAVAQGCRDRIYPRLDEAIRRAKAMESKACYTELPPGINEALGRRRS